MRDSTRTIWAWAGQRIERCSSGRGATDAWWSPADLDFPRLLVMSLSTRPGLILFRGGSYSDKEMTGLLERALDAVAAEVLVRSICVVDRQRVRVTELPPEGTP